MTENIWTPTWEDEPDDYTAFHDGKRIGRVYRSASGQNQWRWFFNMEGYLGVSGHDESRRVAMLELEQHYERVKDAASTAKSVGSNPPA